MWVAEGAGDGAQRENACQACSRLLALLKEKRKEIEHKRKEREGTIALHKGSIIASEVHLRHNYNSLEILPGNRCSK